jgi:hypothetical protein
MIDDVTRGAFLDSRVPDDGRFVIAAGSQQVSGTFTRVPAQTPDSCFVAFRLFRLVIVVLDYHDRSIFATDVRDGVVTFPGFEEFVSVFGPHGYRSVFATCRKFSSVRLLTSQLDSHLNESVEKKITRKTNILLEISCKPSGPTTLPTKLHCHH